MIGFRMLQRQDADHADDESAYEVADQIGFQECDHLAAFPVLLSHSADSSVRLQKAV
jgi:hypothetical protein